MIQVNDTCIGCGVCGEMAKTIFKVEGVSKVIKQPETPEENAECQQAIDMCPVKAISNEESMKMAA
ncbi:MAG: ferredoxin [bacterium]